MKIYETTAVNRKRGRTMRLKNKDIAEMLNISTTAVSLAINNRPGVSEETRRKVMALLRDNANESYESINAAEMTIPGATGSILISVHKKNGEIMNDKPFFSDLVETIQQEAMKQQYTVMIAHYMPGQDLVRYMQYLKGIRCDGIIVFGTEIDEADLKEYMRLERPIVLMDTSFDLAAVDAVALDNQNAMYRAVDYAFQMGHRRFGYLRSATPIMNFVHSYDGFRKALRERGIDQEEIIIDLPTSIDGAYQEMLSFLKDHPNPDMPTIFIAELDYIALGAMKALKETGYRIPEDISMIGYDDVAACEISEPTLTTNRVNHLDIGRLTMQRLVEIIRNPGAYYTTTQVSSELIIRNSVKKLK